MMDRTLLAPPLASAVDTNSDAFRKYRAAMLEQLEVIDTINLTRSFYDVFGWSF